MKKTILTVTAICLAAVLLCSAACFATASYVHKQALVSGPALSAAPAESAGLKASSLALPSSGGERTAEEIYQLACKQVVGISTTVTGYNMFGQLTSNAVTGTGFTSACLPGRPTPVVPPEGSLIVAASPMR